MTVNECTRNNTCFDCDNVKCLLHGKKLSDCPRYHCERQGEGFMNCDSCAFIDRFIENERRRYET